MPIDNSINKIVELDSISFAYGANPVLKSISLDINRGDYLGIIGPNGSGKTTLLKIILGLLRPSTGSVKIFGQNLKDFRDWSKIGYVPQRIANFDVNFPATVQEVVLMGRYARRGLFHRTTKRDREVAKEVLEKVDMWDFKDRLIGDLSGGQQQKVFIARALATEPEIIFLDEPTTSIDSKSQAEFYGLLKRLNQEMSLTLVLISHDIQAVTREVSYVACIDGSLLCHSSPGEFLKDHKLTHHFGHITEVHDANLKHNHN